MKGRQKRILRASALIAGAFLIAQFVATSSSPGETAPVSSLWSAVWETQVQAVKEKVIARPRKVIDLLPLAGAQTTEWTNGNVSLSFPGEETDERGFARLSENVELEDGKVYPKVLETHPEWRNEDGLILGIFKISNLPAKALFEAEVGFRKGPPRPTASSSGSMRKRTHPIQQLPGATTMADSTRSESLWTNMQEKTSSLSLRPTFSTRLPGTGSPRESNGNSP